MDDHNNLQFTSDLRSTDKTMTVYNTVNKSSDRTISTGSVVNIYVPPQAALTLNINVPVNTVSELNEHAGHPAGSPNGASVNTEKREIATNSSVVKPKAEKSEQSIFDRLRLHVVKEPALDLGSRIKIIVKTLTGKSISFSIHTATKVFRLKEAIQDAEGIFPDQQKLSFEGKLLDNEKDFYSYGVQDGNFVTLILDLRGD